MTIKHVIFAFAAFAALITLPAAHAQQGHGDFASDDERTASASASALDNDAPHGRNLLATPCRRRRSASWLASHPRKTGPKEVHHQRPRLPWCDEVNNDVVVAAAVPPSRVITGDDVDPTGNAALTAAVTACFVGGDRKAAWNSADTDDCEISTWDVSSVTNMNAIFEKAPQFNEDISGWDVSKVTDMSELFKDAVAFNGDISNWVVSSVTNMLDMFEGANAFNQDIGGWDVSKVTDMWNMFKECTVFNQNLNNWDVSKVTRMNEMFEDAFAFNGDISSWDVSSVTDMDRMFEDATKFNSDIKNWATSNVQEMDAMFLGATAFNKDITGWSKHANLNSVDMFSGATAWLGTYENSVSSSSLNGPPSDWQVKQTK